MEFSFHCHLSRGPTGRAVIRLPSGLWHTLQDEGLWVVDRMSVICEGGETLSIRKRMVTNSGSSRYVMLEESEASAIPEGSELQVRMTFRGG